MALRILLFLCIGIQCLGQNPAPLPENPDKVRILRKSIQERLLSRDTSGLGALYSQAKQWRGSDLGKPFQDPLYREPDEQEVRPEEVERLWHLCLDQLMAWVTGCPGNPSLFPSALLGTFYTGSKGSGAVPPGHLTGMAAQLYGQQARKELLPLDSRIPSGAFGLVFRKEGEDCALTGSDQRTVLQMCSTYPEICPTFKGGPFAGYRFMVADQFPGAPSWESTLSVPTAWGTEEMVYAFLSLKDSTWFRSAIEAGEWMLQEKPVANPALVARLVWGLAALFDLTGDARYRDRFLFLLEAAILPAILTDHDRNGMVDGTSIPFDSLVPTARTPGRIWDAANASSWGTAASALALVEAYSALRDRGNHTEAHRFLGLAETMMDNLCKELVLNGTPPSGPGFRDMGFVLMEALWRIDKANGSRHPLWEMAAAIIWNAGILRTGNEYSVVVGQYFRHFHSTRYQSRMELARP